MWTGGGYTNTVGVWNLFMYLSSPARSTWRANSAWFVSFLFGVQWIAVGYFLIIIIIGEKYFIYIPKKGSGSLHLKY